MEYKTLNLKDYMPSVEQALALIELEIEVCRREGVGALKVIHGYGSSGVGGEIKKALPAWTKFSIKKGLFKDLVQGERWLSDMEAVKRIKEKCPEVLGDMELYHSNSGISIILI